MFLSESQITLPLHHFDTFQAALPNGDTLKERSMSMSDVLGEPFSTPVSSKNMHRYDS